MENAAENGYSPEKWSVKEAVYQLLTYDADIESETEQAVTRCVKVWKQHMATTRRR